MLLFSLLLLLNNHWTLAQADTVLTIEWSSYLGGIGADRITAMAVDPFGHIYVTGSTDEYWDLDSVATYQDTLGGGASDAFLAKFAPHGALLWATYFGGPGMDEGTAIALDSINTVYLIGNTLSDTMIATTGAQQQLRAGGQDVFIATFSAEGALLRATYAGGTSDDAATGAYFHTAKKLFVSGWTGSDDLFAGAAGPVLAPGGNIDGFVAVYDRLGPLLRHTYVGGSANDTLVGLAGADSLHLVLIGNTASTNGIAGPGTMQPALAGATDGFIWYCDTALTMLRSTYFGGAEDDHLAGLAVDSGRVVICGHTMSDGLYTDTTSFMATRAGATDAFLAVLNDSLGLSWATYYGGTADDRAHAVALDIRGAIHIAGSTSSSDSIATIDMPRSWLSGASDGFVAKFDSINTRAWGTYAGGTLTDAANELHVIGETAVILAGVTMSDDSLAFDGHQMEFGEGPSDGWAMRFQQRIATACSGLCDMDGCPLDQFVVCAGDAISLQTFGGALGIGSTWMWYADECGLPSNFIASGDTLTFVPTQDMLLCVRAESALAVTTCACASVQVLQPPVVELSVSDTICLGEDLLLEADGGTEYQWWVDDSLVAESASATYLPEATGTYMVRVEVALVPTCVTMDSISVVVLPAPEAEWTTVDPLCHGEATGSISLVGDTSLVVTWSGSGATGPVLLDLMEGEYTAVVTNGNSCSTSYTFELEAPSPLVDSVAVIGATCAVPNGSAATHGPSGIALTYDWGNGPSTLATVNGLAPGSHTLIVQDITGCSATLDFVVPAAPYFVAWASPDTVIAVDGSAVLSAGCSPADPAAVYAWSPSGPLSAPQASTMDAVVDSAMVFTVVVTSAEGCSDTASVWVLITEPEPEDICGEFYLPTMFSPNGDGTNDVFRALGGCFTEYEMYIYDRWGGLMFRSTDPSVGWDGSNSGAPVVAGTYMVSFRAQRTVGLPIEQAGTITVVR